MSNDCGIVVYDPNTENPGGAELSATLAAMGRDVLWLLPHGASQAKLVDSRVTAHHVLAGPRPWSLRRVIRYVAGPLFFATAILSGRVGIVMWIHNIWDGTVIAALALIAPERVYFIHNNPRAIRPRDGFAAKQEEFVSRRCHVIVHSTWLRAQALRDNPHHVHVVAHPNYTRTADTAPVRKPQLNTVAYVGGLRADKGASLLVETLIAAGGGFEFRTIGRGTLTPNEVEQLRERNITYVATGRLDQDEFLDELSSVQVVVAPYTQPTESGSTLLCMALDVPVLALDSQTMRRILNDASRFASTMELGAALGRFLRAPWPTFKITPDAQHNQCLADLEAALACQTL